MFSIRSKCSPVSTLVLPLLLAVSAGSADAVAQKTLGEGCSAGGFAPAIELVGRPDPGAEFAVTLSNARPNTNALLVLGYSPQNLSLDYLGAVGCELLVSPEFLIPVAVSASGTADLWFYLPQDPTLIGLAVYAQWGVLDGGSLSTLSVSPALEFVLAETDTASGTFCEGTYNCITASKPRYDGTPGAFQIGARTTIGFWGVQTCPGSTTLGDGSVWNLVPTTCRCD